MKRLLSFVFAAVLAFGALWCVPVNAAENGVQTTADGKYSYRLINRGKAAEIVKYNEKFNNKDEIFTVPEEVDGVTVTSIGRGAFIESNKDGDSSLTRIVSKALVIPDTVNYIGKYAFESCNSVKLTLPESITVIDDYAFMAATLKQLILPDSAKIVGEGAFSFCADLKKAVIGTGVNEISGWCFERCYNLSSVSFGNNVHTISDYAFFECNRLSELHVRESTTCGKYCYGYTQDPDYYSESTFPDAVPVLDTHNSHKLIIEQDESFNDTSLAMDYANENSVSAVLNVNSGKKKEDGWIYNSGYTFRLAVDGKELTGWKSSNPKSVRVSNRGNVAVLAPDNSTRLSVKLKNGKTLRLQINCDYRGPYLVQPRLSGGVSKPRIVYREVKSLTLRKGKAVDLIIIGRVPTIANKYTSKSVAKIIAEPKSDIIRVFGVSRGKALLAVTVNGYKIKFSVTVK